MALYEYSVDIGLIFRELVRKFPKCTFLEC